MSSLATEWLKDKEHEMLRVLEGLVNQDSGTYDPLDVNRLADMLVAPLRDLDAAMVLVSHGEPVLSDGAAAIARALDAGS